MKRRTFTTGLAALTAAPALPLASTTVSQATSAQMATAKMLARAHNRCSPAMLARLMRIDAGLATELHLTLFRQGVITAAGADGTSMAIIPINTNCVPKQALKPTNLIQKARELNTKLGEVLQETGSEHSDQAKED